MNALARAFEKAGFTPVPVQTAPELDLLVAETAPKQVSATVVNRALLFDGAGALVKIPVNAEYRDVMTERDGRIRYVRFAHVVRGGVVNFFLHNRDDPRIFRGLSIMVNVEVWEKILSDGRRFLYVDLYPTAEGDGLDTHVLKVVQGEVPERYRRNRNAVVFDTFAPLQGAVVLVKK